MLSCGFPLHVKDPLEVKNVSRLTRRADQEDRRLEINYSADLEWVMQRTELSRMSQKLWLLGLSLSIPVFGGICHQTSTPSPKHEFRVLAGYSADSPDWVGTARDRSFIMVEASYSYRCWSWEHASLSYTAGVVPAAIVRQPRQLLSVALNPNSTVIVEIPPHAVYGFGVMPVGFFAEFLQHRRFHPIIEGNGGILDSTEPLPEQGTDASSVNFMFNGGGGVRWNAAHSAVTLGYRWVHISNAGRTTFNPGLDNNVFYVSYSFLK